MRDFTSSRFPEEPDAGPDLPNLADLMLVFATGLIAALAAASQHETAPRPVEVTQDTSANTQGQVGDGQGLEAAGQVFRDPATGKLYLVK